MRADAHVSIGCRDGLTFLADARCEPPFRVHCADGRFLFVSSAAAPVGGDELALTVDVAPGAVADIGTVAAMLVWPSAARDGARSSLVTTVRVWRGAHLTWRPEPTVSIAGSNHLVRTTIDLAEGATCEVVEEYALGRHDEPSGDLLTELRITRDGRGLLHHGERFGPTINTARHVLAAASVGSVSDTSSAAPSAVVIGEMASAARLPGAEPGTVLVLAAGRDRPSVLAAAGEVGDVSAARRELAGVATPSANC